MMYGAQMGPVTTQTSTVSKCVMSRLATVSSVCCSPVASKGQHTLAAKPPGCHSGSVFLYNLFPLLLNPPPPNNKRLEELRSF